MKVVINQGPVVFCDFCNADHTTQSAPGGFLFGSYAVCPKCAERMLPGIEAAGEERYIKERARPGEFFRDFVFRLRIRESDSKDSKIIIQRLL